jgi:hypothetical protein
VRSNCEAHSRTGDGPGHGEGGSGASIATRWGAPSLQAALVLLTLLLVMLSANLSYKSLVFIFLKYGCVSNRKTQLTEEIRRTYMTRENGFLLNEIHKVHSQRKKEGKCALASK